MEFTFADFRQTSFRWTHHLTKMSQVMFNPFKNTFIKINKIKTHGNKIKFLIKPLINLQNTFFVLQGQLYVWILSTTASSLIILFTRTTCYL